LPSAGNLGGELREKIRGRKGDALQQWAAKKGPDTTKRGETGGTREKLRRGGYRGGAGGRRGAGLEAKKKDLFGDTTAKEKEGGNADVWEKKGPHAAYEVVQAKLTQGGGEKGARHSARTSRGIAYRVTNRGRKVPDNGGEKNRRWGEKKSRACSGKMGEKHSWLIKKIQKKTFKGHNRTEKKVACTDKRCRGRGRISTKRLKKKSIGKKSMWIEAKALGKGEEEGSPKGGEGATPRVQCCKSKEKPPGTKRVVHSGKKSQNE